MTKLPSAAVGVVGIISEFKRNNLPFDKAQATLFSLGMYSNASTDTLGSFSNEYENNL